jgi:hypothetical protein
MKAVITGSLVALAISVTAAAQDSTVKSQTKVSGDDAKAVTMRGCLQQTATGNGFLLLGGITASGDELKSKSKVKTDVDDDKTTVKGRTTTQVDDGDRAVATAGAAAAYAVTPRSGVDLASHAGQEVEINAVLIDARKGGDKDADITIKDKTTIDREDAPDSKVQSKTKADVARGPLPQLMAMSVKSLGRACSAQ